MRCMPARPDRCLSLPRDRPDHTGGADSGGEARRRAARAALQRAASAGPPGDRDRLDAAADAAAEAVAGGGPEGSRAMEALTLAPSDPQQRGSDGSLSRPWLPQKVPFHTRCSVSHQQSTNHATLIGLANVTTLYCRGDCRVCSMMMCVISLQAERSAASEPKQTFWQRRGRKRAAASAAAAALEAGAATSGSAFAQPSAQTPGAMINCLDQVLLLCWHVA